MLRLSDLPPEILFSISMLLNPRDLANLACVSQTFANLSEDRTLWASLYQRYYPTRFADCGDSDYKKAFLHYYRREKKLISQRRPGNQSTHIDTWTLLKLIRENDVSAFKSYLTENLVTVEELTSPEELAHSPEKTAYSLQRDQALQAFLLQMDQTSPVTHETIWQITHRLASPAILDFIYQCLYIYQNKLDCEDFIEGSIVCKKDHEIEARLNQPIQLHKVLVAACKYGKLELLKSLFKKYQSEKKLLPVTPARLLKAAAGHPEIITWLLSTLHYKGYKFARLKECAEFDLSLYPTKNINLEQNQENESPTPLTHVIAPSSERRKKSLISAILGDTNSLNPFFEVALKGSTDSMYALLQLDRLFTIPGLTGDEKIFKRTLPSVNALHLTVKNDYVRITQQILLYLNLENLLKDQNTTLNFNAIVNQPEKSRANNAYTPLHYAIKQGNKKLVEVLLRYHADKTMICREFENPTDPKLFSSSSPINYTPLMLARKAGHSHLETLLQIDNSEQPKLTHR